ncbi:carbonic anhydrase/acetyltransferase-like protein (isoleucine patch superfamily) [Bacillus oleivorans]|uniref:Carbonic anhydrase/acetyltransferase-like protein (Isoleucine patch superfamily) n=1 Tax=Bacillus oleivorans TaxID=1448271 RepID=A0A285CQU3_9BACI|nr:gamma carbonic anhydrase family protein [Bacillus oleivorans]SNX69917.1 carbonic anhydrase/acetyltransferase-like protein (isoleucine patch superfamily) [Bacillus oleivorans]
MIIKLNGDEPKIHPSVFIAPGAYIIGQVEIGENSSVWFNSVLRGDEGPITIGKRCNVQDNCTLHLYEGFPLILEDEVSVGHNAILHGCHIKKGSLIGMGATVLDGVEVGEESLIGANSFIPSGKKIPPRSLVLGSPGKVVRELSEKDFEMLRMTVQIYEEKARQFKEQLALQG